MITPLSTLYNSLILKGLKFNSFLAKNCKPSIYRALEKRVESQVSDYKISTVLEFGLGIAFGKDLVEELMPYIMEKSSESKIPQINNAIYCIGLSNILDHPILDIYEFLNKGKELGLDEAEDMFADVAEDMQEVVANPLNFIHSIIHYAGRLSEEVSDDIFSRGGSYGIQLRQLFQ